jgi:hypothetical protein
MEPSSAGLALILNALHDGLRAVGRRDAVRPVGLVDAPARMAWI